MAHPPTEEELRQLPLRAIIAYAVRRARRVQPLYQIPSKLAEWKRYMAAVDEAITWAEGYAGTTNLIEPIDATPTVLGKAVIAAAKAANNPAAKAAANAAMSAIIAAANAASAGSHNADKANAAAAVGAKHALPSIVAKAADAAAKTDFQKLLSLDLGRFPERGQPIDPTETGPVGSLWPDGPPDWYTQTFELMQRLHRRKENVPQASGKISGVGRIVARTKTGTENPVSESEPPPIELYIDPGNASKETIQEVLESLSDLHRAAGGLGLEFRVGGTYIAAAEEAR